MMQLMDEEIGKILACLKAEDLYDNTIILFTTDHGDYIGNHGFRGKGFPSYEEVYNIPFIVKNQNHENAGKRSSALLGTLDIAPTLLEMAGIQVPAAMEGLSQKALFEGSTAKIRTAFIIENRAVEKGFYQKMIVRERYKLVYYYGQSYGELYDLSVDPDQYQNLWNDEAYKGLKSEMLFQLHEKNVKGDPEKDVQFGIPELLLMLDKQIDGEGPVQKRTSFS